MIQKAPLVSIHRKTPATDDWGVLGSAGRIKFIMLRMLPRTVLLMVAMATLMNAQERLRAEPAAPAPGSLIRITLAESSGARVTQVRGSMAGEQLHFLRHTDGSWRALGPVPADATDSVLVLAIVSNDAGSADTLRTRVRMPPAPPPAPPSGLRVDSQFTRPYDAETQARITRESQRAFAVGRLAHNSPPLWRAPFLRPRPETARITSGFGSGRTFNGAVTSRHLGVDLQGAVGAPIVAANRGVVALVDTFFLGGIVTYINHGAGVVTGYLHQSRVVVAVGDTVQRGQEIGRVGATGRVTGPHLHWLARFGAVTVNPLDLTMLDAEWYPVNSPGAPRLRE